MSHHYSFADDCFADLLSVAQSNADVRSRYTRLYMLLIGTLNDCTSDQRLNFANPLAKIDYLCRENGFTDERHQRLNDFRGRYNNLDQFTDDQLSELLPDDLKVVAEFASTVYRRPLETRLVALLPAIYRPRHGVAITQDYVRATVEAIADHSLRVRNSLTGDTMTVELTDDDNYFGDFSYVSRLVSVGSQINLVHLRGSQPELIVYEPDILINISNIASCFEKYGNTPYASLIARFLPNDTTSAILLGNFASQMLDEEINRIDSPPTYAESVERFFRNNALQLATCPGIDANFHAEARRQQQNIRRMVNQTFREVRSIDLDHIMLEPSFFCEMLGVQGRMDLLQDDLKVLMEQKSGKRAYSGGHETKHYVQMLLYLALIHYNYRLRNDDIDCFLLYSKYDDGLIKESPAPRLLFEALKIRNQLAALEEMLADGRGRQLLERLTPELLNTAHLDGRLWTEWIRPRLDSVLTTIHSASPLEKSYFYRLLTFVAKEHLRSKIGTPQKEASGFAAIWTATLEEKRAAGNIIEGLSLVRGLALMRSEESLMRSEEREARSENSFSMGSEERGVGSENTLDVDGNLMDKEGKKAKSEITLEFLNPPSNVPTPQNYSHSSLLTPHSSLEESHSSLKKSHSPSDDSFASPNFRQGDIVILYPYRRDTAPDARRTMLIRATITEITTHHVSLRLRSPQPVNTPAGCCWAIEHDYMESSQGALYRGLLDFLKATPRRRELLLGQRRPEHTERKLKGDYGQHNSLVEKAKQSDDCFILIGPPGTGKTSFGLVTILKEQLAEGGNVLLLSFTNRAVDEICSKLVRQDIDFIRLGSGVSCPPEYQSFMLNNRAADCKNVEQIKSLVRETRVVVSTTTSMLSSSSLFAMKRFDLAIIDEASQILEPQLLGILCARHGEADAIGRFVLIGDHKQLPAVVMQTADESEVSEPELREIGLTNCRNSLFERLLNLYGDDPSTVFHLTRQGRMHEQIETFPNEAFYEGRLQTVPMPHQQQSLPFAEYDHDDPYETLVATQRQRFIDVKKRTEASDKVNPDEAREIAQIAAAAYRLYEKNGLPFTPQSVGVIVPYRHQIACVRRELAATGIAPLSAITIDTVERYQGSERDIIVYGFTVSRRYQLAFLTSNVFEERGQLIDRKLNVALTRAREQLFIIGDKSLLSIDPIFRRLVRTIG